MSIVVVDPLALASTEAPLYLSAILLPVFAFPAWILCIPPLFWHFRQGNVASGSLFLWTIMVNVFNSINSLIWPRDNVDEWWNGNVWCDINVRIQIGAMVGTTASAVMIVRKLAKVMDTHNITVTSSRDSKMKEKILEILWCWVYPLVLILVYYIVQPIRYFVLGITGCLAAYHTSWPSIALGYMWAPITILVAAGYAVLLSYRLYRYRREFARLVAARNTNKSRFIRLFVICIIIIAAYVPYTIWLLVVLIRQVRTPYSWEVVHAPESFNSIMFRPAGGIVNLDNWGQVASGYVLFVVFGTGSDAYNSYKKMGIAMGLGRVWPALYVSNESGAAMPNSFIVARAWTQSWSSKAKSKFWSRSGSVAEETLVGSERHGSVAVVGASQEQRGSETSWVGRVFGRKSQQQTVLPVSMDNRKGSVVEMTELEHKSVSPGASARVWASKLSSAQSSEDGGVCVFHEVRLECQELDDQVKDRKSDDACAV